MVAATWLTHCRFPPAGSDAACAFSGGPDSTALVILAREHGLRVTAHHVDHGHRASSARDAERAGALAAELGVAFVVHRANVDAGANFEARARAVRYALLPDGALTGHTADDQAETMLLRLMRGTGADGAAAMSSERHPLLQLRRVDTVAVCAAAGVEPIDDPSNAQPRHRRNRVRHELLPLLDDIAERDVVPLLTRFAELSRDDRELLERLASGLDPADARALADAPLPLARRAIRAWLAPHLPDGYPPDAAAVERVLDVARGTAERCQVAAGISVARSSQRLRIITAER